MFTIIYWFILWLLQNFDVFWMPSAKEHWLLNNSKKTDRVKRHTDVMIRNISSHSMANEISLKNK